MYIHRRQLCRSYLRLKDHARAKRFAEKSVALFHTEEGTQLLQLWCVNTIGAESLGEAQPMRGSLGEGQPMGQSMGGFVGGSLRGMAGCGGGHCLLHNVPCCAIFRSNEQRSDGCDAGDRTSSGTAAAVPTGAEDPRTRCVCVWLRVHMHVYMCVCRVVRGPDVVRQLVLTLLIPTYCMVCVCVCECVCV